jgi:glucuronate isomerase
MSDHDQIKLLENRLFSPDSRQSALAGYLYQRVECLPLICPHGHIDPQIFVDPNYSFGTPTSLLLIPDHYIYRMLHSQGIPLAQLGVPGINGKNPRPDDRKIWQIFAEHFYLFRGTPSGFWLNSLLQTLFEVRVKLNGKTAQAVYDQVEARLASLEYTPHRLYERFNIEVLCTTDPATDPLESHRAVHTSGWQGRILPTFRPDGIVDMNNPAWIGNIHALSQASGIDVANYASYIQSIENRRLFFKEMGAVATDHAALTAYTTELSDREAESLFERGLTGKSTPEDASRFMGHMLIMMAQMSIEDGLVMQLHVGSFRDHSPDIYTQFGKDKGADIPVACEFTRNLKPLLDKVGNDPRLGLVLFTLDETAYARELGPLAGLYPALKLGPPWWFHDSPNGIMRYLENVTETAGIYNLAGFNDDTRSFPSILARHDVWRRVCADWLAGLVLRGRIDLDDAEAMVEDLSYNLAKKTYRL